MAFPCHGLVHLSPDKEGSLQISAEVILSDHLYHKGSLSKWFDKYENYVNESSATV